jgi:hypothetical protein
MSVQSISLQQRNTDQNATDQASWDADNTSNGISDEIAQRMAELWVGSGGSARESDERSGEESNLHFGIGLKFWNWNWNE